MLRRITLSVLTLALTPLALTASSLTTSSLTTPMAYAAPAPDRAAKSPGWTEADKTGFGTARSRQSKVWFTMQDGQVSEVFYPDLSTPSIRNLELTVTDGGHRDRATKDMTLSLIHI